jgi:acetyl-CoA synthetase
MRSDSPTDTFRACRDLLIECASNYDAACERFRWPQLTEFNWALDWFDSIGRTDDRPALLIVNEDGAAEQWTFAALSERSNRTANWLRSHGVGRGDRIIVMLDNQAELWQVMLAAIKLGAVMVPCTTLLTPADLADRVERGQVRHVITTSMHAAKFDNVGGRFTRMAVGEPVPGWMDYSDSAQADSDFTADGITRGDDTLLLYFTSGTTAKPKLVEHTHVSYPVGHLSTMYWIGLRPGDVHLNIASPGWAKHAWSNFFAPWNAEATIFVHNYARFDAAGLMRQMQRYGVTSFCAPPTVWRMLIQADLSALRTPPQKAVSAGEPLNPEVIEQVQKAWGLTIRDGFGQTETSVQIANTPGQKIIASSMGRAVPGFRIALVDPITGEPGDEGEICIDLAQRPAGLMAGYLGDTERNNEVMRGGYYHTGDVASRDEAGYITYVGRSDDVFKSSDYRISPFELESVLLEHDAVAEAAVVPSPDPIRLTVPKAYVVLADGWPPTADTARQILAYARANLAPYKRIRRLQFADLPKTISGKIRRVDLRTEEAARIGTVRNAAEFWEEDVTT